jgi:hypothetical protein
MKLYLQVRSLEGKDWQTVNTRDTSDVGKISAVADLLKIRDQWRMTEFPNGSFRIVPKEKLHV